MPRPHPPAGATIPLIAAAEQWRDYWVLLVAGELLAGGRLNSPVAPWLPIPTYAWGFARPPWRRWARHVGRPPAPDENGIPRARGGGMVAYGRSIHPPAGIILGPFRPRDSAIARGIVVVDGAPGTRPVIYFDVRIWPPKAGRVRPAQPSIDGLRRALRVAAAETGPLTQRAADAIGAAAGASRALTRRLWREMRPAGLRRPGRRPK